MGCSYSFSFLYRQALLLRHALWLDLPDELFDLGLEMWGKRKAMDEILLCFHFAALQQAGRPAVDISFRQTWVELNGTVEVGDRAGQVFF